jgi:hypothetical protein
VWCATCSVEAMRALLLAVVSLVGCSGLPSLSSDSSASSSSSSSTRPIVASVADGEDWSLPERTATSFAPSSGFFHEHASPEAGIDTRVIDVSWRQLEPRPGEWLTDEALAATPAHYGDLDFASLDEQRARGGPYWMRIWLTDVDLAPEWLKGECPDAAVIDGTGYLGDRHIPIFDACVWQHAKALYEHVFGIVGDDPNLRFVYVPGAFTYSEFDFDLVKASGVSFADFSTWFHGAMKDLVDAAGPHANKLVYTGEDYPFSAFGADDDLLARDAVAAGLGIRTGITELFNFHLNHVPAYGITIAEDGHLVVDESWVGLAPDRIRATENECYEDCGFAFPAEHLTYAVEMSNLKALQMRMNWVYVDAGLVERHPEFFRWVRAELGKSVEDAPDAWVVLREAEDVYWSRDDDSHTWTGAPFIRNWERWVVQRDVPGAMTERGTELRIDPGPESDGTMGVAYEGRRTARATGNDAIAFFVEPRFVASGGAAEIKVTYVDNGASFRLGESADVKGTGSGAIRTATFALETLPSEFRIFATGAEDLEVRMVRIVRR